MKYDAERARGDRAIYDAGELAAIRAELDAADARTEEIAEWLRKSGHPRDVDNAYLITRRFSGGRKA